MAVSYSVVAHHMVPESQVAFEISAHITELMSKGYRIKNTTEGKTYTAPYMEYFVIIEFDDEIDEMRYHLEY